MNSIVAGVRAGMVTTDTLLDAAETIPGEEPTAYWAAAMLLMAVRGGVAARTSVAEIKRIRKNNAGSRNDKTAAVPARGRSPVHPPYKAPSPFVPLPPGERGRGEGRLHTAAGSGLKQYARERLIMISDTLSLRYGLC
jgi:hypothetical protein